MISCQSGRVGFETRPSFCASVRGSGESCRTQVGGITASTPFLGFGGGLSKSEQEGGDADKAEAPVRLETDFSRGGRRLPFVVGYFKVACCFIHFSLCFWSFEETRGGLIESEEEEEEEVFRGFPRIQWSWRAADQRGFMVCKLVMVVCVYL
jgi:hypothetical protein